MIVELITFLVMMAVLARWVYPEIVKLAEARQRPIAEQLTEAEKARADAEARLKEAEAKLNDARKTAQTVIEGATKSGEQLRQELKQKAEEEAKRIDRGRSQGDRGRAGAGDPVRAQRGREPRRGGDREGHRRDARRRASTSS